MANRTSARLFPAGAVVGRRGLLKGSAALAFASALGPVGCTTGVKRGNSLSDYPFTLGIASGDPLADRVMLWTRLAPRPFDEDGGMERDPVMVRWQVADDEGFTRIRNQGQARAEAAHAHSVHVDAAGLEPGRSYFYRFIAGDAVSPTGRTRAAPAPGTLPARLRLASVGCQNFEAGYYAAYRRLAEEDLDLVIHTGDYIYEGPARKKRAGLVRAHPDHDCVSLAQYRLRYALYKGDADLQAAHAAHPFAVVIDDHEVANNWASDIDGKGRGGDDFRARRAAGLKAWWEHMPVRARPQNGGIRIYRALDYGTLAHINLCDTRQYRAHQPCGGGTVPHCPEDTRADLQIFGAMQESWLRQTLAGSRARWNVIAQQVVMAEMNRAAPGEESRFDMDKWDGYRPARDRFLGFLEDARIANPVILSGDIHRHIAAELRRNFSRPATPALATELVNTSISSRGDGNPKSRATRNWLAVNPHFHYARDLRGYIRHTLSAARWQADFRVLDSVASRNASVRTDASFVIEAGRPRLLTA